MTEGLPKGLVTNSEAITGDIQGVDHIDAEDLAHLWRVYTTNRNLLANDVGRRLENFFWRIWSNGSIRETIRGREIARLFIAISEGDVVIRTTPTSSPRASRILPTFRLADRLSPSPTPAGEGFVEPELAGIDEQVERMPGPQEPDSITARPPQAPTIEEEKGRRRGSSRPPPILKKPRTESTAQGSKTARILTPTWKTPRRDSRDDTSFPQASSSRSSQTNATKHTEASSNLLSEALPSTRSPATPQIITTKPAKKKPTFTASSSTTKRRPTLPHRKSSNTTGGTPASKAPSPRLASQTTHSPPPSLPSFTATTSTTRHDDSALSRSPLEPASTAPHPPPPPTNSPPPPPTRSPHPPASAPHRRPTSRSASPVSSTPFHRPSRDHLPTRASSPPSSSTTAVPGAAPQDWLVEPHFRAKFADRATVEGRGKVSTARARPVQTGGRGRMGEGDARRGRRVEEEEEAVVDDDEDDDHDHDDDDDDDDEDEEGSDVEDETNEPGKIRLPRTKSQLTMLLERDRGVGAKKAAKGAGNTERAKPGGEGSWRRGTGG